MARFATLNTLLWIFAGITYSSAATSQPAGSIISKSCTTHVNQPGTCIKIKDCPELNALLGRRNEASARDILRRSHCGYEGREIVTCCSKNRQQPPPPPNRAGAGSVAGPPQNLELRLEELMQCGKSNFTNSRITGGQDAELGSWPWIAGLGYPERGKLRYMCGGTLISERHVVTAAHCISESSVRPTEVRLGDLNLNDSVNDGAYPINIPIESIVTHERHKTYPQQINDIAMITLKHPVKFNKHIRPLCLPTLPTVRTNTYSKKKLFYIAGWGTTVSNEEAYPDVLQETQVPSWENEKCKESYRKFLTVLIDDKVICAGGDGRDSCQGDSGGPLVMRYGSTLYLIGIVSFGGVCGDPDQPGVYTRVTEYLDWINKHADTRKIFSVNDDKAAARVKRTIQQPSRGKVDETLTIATK